MDKEETLREDIKNALSGVKQRPAYRLFIERRKREDRTAGKKKGWKPGRRSGREESEQHSKKIVAI